jgi:hypothetical protein
VKAAIIIGAVLFIAGRLAYAWALIEFYRRPK